MNSASIAFKRSISHASLVKFVNVLTYDNLSWALHRLLQASSILEVSMLHPSVEDNRDS